MELLLNLEILISVVVELEAKGVVVRNVLLELLVTVLAELDLVGELQICLLDLVLEGGNLSLVFKLSHGSASVSHAWTSSSTECTIVIAKEQKSLLLNKLGQAVVDCLFKVEFEFSPVNLPRIIIIDGLEDLSLLIPRGVDAHARDHQEEFFWPDELTTILVHFFEK